MIQENIFRQTMNRISNVSNIEELARECRNFINHHVFRDIKLTPLQLLSLFESLHQRYQRINRRCPQLSWLEDQKKIYQCFILAYSFQNSKKIKDLQNQEWEQISKLFNNKNLLLLRYEAKIIERTHERVRWTQQEEQLLSACTIVRQLKWAEISRHIFYSSQGRYFKTPKQCRERWNNHMNQQISREAWTIDEDIQLLEWVEEEGHKWARISLGLGSKRTEHMIKNRFNSLMTCARNLVGRKNRLKVQESQLIKRMKIILEQRQKKLAPCLGKRNKKEHQISNYIYNRDQEQQLLQSENSHHRDYNTGRIRSNTQRQGPRQNAQEAQEQAQAAYTSPPMPYSMMKTETSELTGQHAYSVASFHPTAPNEGTPMLSIPAEAVYYMGLPSLYNPFFQF